MFLARGGINWIKGHAKKEMKRVVHPMQGTLFKMPKTMHRSLLKRHVGMHKEETVYLIHDTFGAHAHRLERQRRRSAWCYPPESMQVRCTDLYQCPYLIH